ncbi:MAG: carboxypeptidase-like regulatory domain-containing protein [Bryobacteraceae bacterium]
MTFRYIAPIFLGVAAMAQPPADQKAATIEGTVINSVTKVPLRKVEVTLTNGEITQEMAAMMQQFKPGGPAQESPKVTTKTLSATTDAAGKFRFDNVAPGTYWLTGKKAGFEDGTYSGSGDEGSLRISAGQESVQADLKLVPYGTLSGMVVDEDGEPFPSATVTALRYGFQTGRRRTMMADAAQTNNKGEFSLSKIPPGHYFLCADIMRMGFGAKAPPPPADGSPETAYVGTYFPGALDVAQAQGIDVAAGAEIPALNIQLRKSKVVRVSGKLTDANGEPVKTAQIMLMGGSRVGSMSMNMIGDPQGKFELTNLQPGTYNAMVIQMQGSSPKMTMLSLVVPENGARDVVLGVPPEATIQGHVKLDGDARVELKDFPITLTGSEAVAAMPVTGKADKSGAFTLEHVVPTSYDLMLPFSPPGTYVKSVLFNDREELGRVLDLSGMTAGTLQISLGTDGGKVDAKVSRDDKPAANATVVLVPADPNRRCLQTVRKGSSDETGHVTLKDVPPGDYLAYAWEQVEDGAWFDADFMKNTQAPVVKVQVGPKDNQQIELKLPPA